MFHRLWSWLRNPTSRPAVARRPAASRPRHFRPGLDSLEGRVLPAGWVGGVVGVVVSVPTMTVAGTGLTQTAPAPGSSAASAPAKQIDVVVPMNAPDTVTDLSQVLADWTGFRAGGTPRMWVTRNTNRGLVTASLSDAELTLAYAAGRTGSASVTVLSQDGSGASIQVTFAITVGPSDTHAVAAAPSLRTLVLPAPKSPLLGR